MRFGRGSRPICKRYFGPLSACYTSPHRLDDMSNPFLAVLVPNHARYFGAEGVAHRVTQLLPDPVAQSPRLYAVLSKGGGVIHKEDVARSLATAGFTVTTFRATSRERGYLASIDPAFRSGTLWLVTCDAGIAVKKDGAVACVPTPGLKPVSMATAKETGAVGEADFGPATRWVSKSSIAGWRIFGSSAQPTPDVVQRAVDTVRLWNEIATHVERIETAANVSRLPMPASVHAQWLRATVFLAETAQPVAVVSKIYKPPAAQRFGAIQVPVAMIVVGVIVLGVVAGLVYLASKHAEATQIAAEMQKGGEEFRKPLLDCVADRSRSPQERAACGEALKNLPTTEPPKDFLEKLTELAPYAAGVLTLGLGAWYLGPLIREASETGAAGIERFRQTRLGG